MFSKSDYDVIIELLHAHIYAHLYIYTHSRSIIFNVLTRTYLSTTLKGVRFLQVPISSILEKEQNKSIRGSLQWQIVHTDFRQCVLTV